MAHPCVHHAASGALTAVAGGNSAGDQVPCTARTPAWRCGTRAAGNRAVQAKRHSDLPLAPDGCRARCILYLDGVGIRHGSRPAGSEPTHRADVYRDPPPGAGKLTPRDRHSMPGSRGAVDFGRLVPGHSYLRGISAPPSNWRTRRLPGRLASTTISPRPCHRASARAPAESAGRRS